MATLACSLCAELFNGQTGPLQGTIMKHLEGAKEHSPVDIGWTQDKERGCFFCQRYSCSRLPALECICIC